MHRVIGQAVLLGAVLIGEIEVAVGKLHARGFGKLVLP